MLSQFRLPSIPHAPGVAPRAIRLALGGRFTDEILSGLPDVLMPTLRAHLGLTYTQISLLHLALNYVAAVVEPIAALLIDVWHRRWLLAWGAAGVGIATALMGVAPTFLILLLGFAIYGLASGPLAHTADVVLVESHPDAPDAIFTRATTIDTIGALLAPLLVAAAVWAGLSWRGLLVGLGLGSVVYAVLLLRTPFPLPPNSEQNDGQPLVRTLFQNLRTVLRNKQMWQWLAFLLVFDVLEAPILFRTVWLNEEAGMSQALIGIYKGLEMVTSLVTLLILERWLPQAGHRRILTVASIGLLIIYPLWLFLPGIWPRFLLAIPLNFLLTVYWPIGRAQSLLTVPGNAGAVTAVQSLFAILPLPLLFGLAAEAVGLTQATLWVSLGALLLLLLIIWRMSDHDHQQASPRQRPQPSPEATA